MAGAVAEGAGAGMMIGGGLDMASKNDRLKMWKPYLLLGVIGRC